MSAKTIWECDSCEHQFSMDAMPYDCPNCDYYHCGDMTCCTGEGFMAINPDENVPCGTNAPPEEEDTKPGKLKNPVASPTAKHLAKDKEDVCFHGAMFNPNCPVCVERRCKSCDGTGDVQMPQKSKTSNPNPLMIPPHSKKVTEKTRITVYNCKNGEAPPTDREVLEVDAWCVGGATGIVAYFMMDGYMHEAHGDDGNWWVVGKFNPHWLEEMQEVLGSVEVTREDQRELKKSRRGSKSK